ncbi:MAG: hypothetical protein NT004_04845 [Bacteroidetes bacterium]|nr:hypothetical protein [Bacteroidota bacterium]
MLQYLGILEKTGIINTLFNSGSFYGKLTKHKVELAEKGDFRVDEKYTFEIGGKGKTRKQIAGIPSGYVVVDDTETGYENKIPLWLFGFLY